MTTAIAPPRADPAAIREALSLLVEPGAVVELRIPHARRAGIVSGYYDDLDDLAGDAAAANGRYGTVYVTLNPPNPALLARRVNRYEEWAKETTNDADIVRRRWLLVDLDPKRPAGISATDAEHAAALDRANDIRVDLTDAGWPAPIDADSGNGGHLLYRVDLPNDDAALALVKGVLAGLASRYSDEHVAVDQSVHNAARISKLYGTVAMKGDNTRDRPHRLAFLLDVPAAPVPVTPEQLATVAAWLPQAPPDDSRNGHHGPTLAGVLAAAGIAYKEQPVDAAGITWFHVKRCPFHEDGPDFECGPGQVLPDGKLTGHCFHNRGAGKGWAAFRQALGLGAAFSRNGQTPAATDAHQRRFAPTDAGNGELFAALYGNRLRYDHRRGQWLIWAGHRWEPDRVEQVYQLATEATRERYQRAASIHDLKDRAAEASFAIGSENRGKLEAALRAARTEPPIADAGANWDKDPWLLCVQNGVLDLRQGTLRPGRQEDRITKQAPVAFDPLASCPTFERFMERIQPAADMRAYLQRRAGYALTGITREQDLIFAHGAGSNGKSTFANALMDVLGGEYSQQAAPGLLLVRRHEEHPTELAELDGARLVVSTEVDDGRALAEALIKQATGGEKLKGRFMRQDFFEFEPAFKLLLQANHKPVVRDTTKSIWRRIKLVPFDETIADSERDDQLPEKLKAETPGILNWMIAGCLDWQRGGMRQPAAVTNATDTYRVDMDRLAPFFEDCCLVGPRYSAGATALFRAYQRWADEQGQREKEQLTATAFGRRMTERYQKKKTLQGLVYEGIGLWDPDHPGDHAGLGVEMQGFTPSDQKVPVNTIESLSRETNRETLHNPACPASVCGETGFTTADQLLNLADLCDYPAVVLPDKAIAAGVHGWKAFVAVATSAQLDAAALKIGGVA